MKITVQSRCKPHLACIRRKEAELHYEQGVSLRGSPVEVSIHHASKRSNSEERDMFFPILFLVLLIFFIALIPIFNAMDHGNVPPKCRTHLTCPAPCRMSLVESIPEGLVYPSGAPKFPSTYEQWSNLLKKSTESIHIASFYWSLRGADVYPHPSAYQGEEIFKMFVETSQRDVKLKIVQNVPSKGMPSTDTEELQKIANAEVRSLNFTALLGGGVLHTKFWIVDGKHIYVGSANMDWRSLTQVKEMGVVVNDCPCLAKDLMKIFNVYWDLGAENAVVPPRWPDSYATPIDIETPLITTCGEAFLTSSPPPLSPPGRTDDATAIVSLIQKAEKFVYISVMDYIPLIIYSPSVKFWPFIDNAIKTAAIDQKINIRLLVSKWNHTRKAELKFLRSLSDISGTYRGVMVEVKLFAVPASPDQQKIPFARVNHNKYMVTDNAAYVGTSNWCGDYFTNTAGVGLIMQPHCIGHKLSTLLIREHLESVFLRDWNSPYAKYLGEEDF